MDSSRKGLSWWTDSAPFLSSPLLYTTCWKHSRPTWWIEFISFNDESYPTNILTRQLYELEIKVYHINSLSITVVRFGILARRKVYTTVFEFVFYLQMITFPWNKMMYFFWRRGKFKIVDHWLSSISTVISFLFFKKIVCKSLST